MGREQAIEQHARYRQAGGSCEHPALGACPRRRARQPVSATAPRASGYFRPGFADGDIADAPPAMLPVPGACLPRDIVADVAEPRTGGTARAHARRGRHAPNQPMPMPVVRNAPRPMAGVVRGLRVAPSARVAGRSR